MSTKFGDTLLKGTLKLIVGSGAAKFLGILSMPILTRVYSVEDIGVLTVLNSFVMLLVPIMTLRYVVMIPLPRTDMFAFGIVNLSLAFSIGFSALLILMITLAPIESYLLESMLPVSEYLWIVPLLALGMSVNEILSMWMIRKRKYGPIGRVQVIQTFSGEIVKIFIGFLGWRPFGLLIGQSVYILIGIILSYMAATKHQSARIFRIRLRPMRLALWRYRSVPAFRLPAQFLLIYSMQAPQIFSVIFYSTSEAGLVGMAAMAVSLPFSIIGQAAGRAYYAEISILGNRNPIEIQKLTKYITKKLTIFSLPASLVIYFFGEYIFQNVFGPDWKIAGRLASTMSIFIVFQFAVSPMLNIFNVFEAPGKFLVVHLQRAIIVTTAFLIAKYLELTIEEAILLYSISLSFHYVWTALRITKFMKQKCDEG